MLLYCMVKEHLSVTLNTSADANPVIAFKNLLEQKEQLLNRAVNVCDGHASTTRIKHGPSDSFRFLVLLTVDEKTTV